ncbi:MAG: NAD(+) synthetase, partial [Bacillota bacterium]
MFDKDYSQIKDKLITWIQKQVKNADCRGTVVGLSGGIDSS